MQIEMPEMGESVTEGIVLEWHVAEGDFVAEGDTVVEVSTDKVDAEVPAPMDGVITKLIARSTKRCRWGRRWRRWSRVRVATHGRGIERVGRGSCRGGRRLVLASCGRGTTPPRHPRMEPLKFGRTGANGGASDVRATPVARRVAEATGVDLGVDRWERPRGEGDQGGRACGCERRRGCWLRPPARRSRCGGRRRCWPRRWTRAGRCRPRPPSARLRSTRWTPSARR